MLTIDSPRNMLIMELQIDFVNVRTFYIFNKLDYSADIILRKY